MTIHHSGSGSGAYSQGLEPLLWSEPLGLKSGLARALTPEPPRVLPAPAPIPGGLDIPPLGFIHFFLPGPEGATTPFFKLPASGLDVEPSTITDFKGFTAFAVFSGEAVGSDGNPYNVEFDVRVMQGDYMAEDGSQKWGTFGFF